MFVKLMTVSISQTFHDQLFCTKVVLKSLCGSLFVFVISWQKEIGKKAAQKMLVKLMTGVHFTNI